MKKLATLALFFFLAANAGAMDNALKLTLTGNGHYDEIVVRFDTAGSTGYNPNLDAWKMFSPILAVGQLYTLCAPGEPLCVYAMPESALDTIIELYTLINQPGNYTIKGSEYAPFNKGECIQLEDSWTGQRYDLRSGTAFSFSLGLMTDSTTARFRVHFKAPPRLAALPVSCYSLHDGAVVVGGAGTSGWGYSVTNSNNILLGSNSNLQGNDTLKNMGSGAYTIQVSNASGCAYKDTFSISQPPPVEAKFVASDTLIDLAMGAEVDFQNLSENASGFHWSFGDGSAVSCDTNPSYTFHTQGLYTVVLQALQNSCKSSAVKHIRVYDEATGIAGVSASGKIQVTHTGDFLRIENNSTNGMPLEASLFTTDGRLMLHFTGANASNYEIPVNQLPAAIYIVQVSCGNQVISQKITW
jgi:hypothetical protein